MEAAAKRVSLLMAPRVLAAIAFDSPINCKSRNRTKGSLNLTVMLSWSAFGGLGGDVEMSDGLRG